MKKAILATKVGMTQIFNEDGVLVPVTVLQAGPCVVTQVKTVENDGYEAVQVAFVDKKDKVINKDAKGNKEVIHRHGVNKALQGHFKKAGVTSKRYVREFKFENAAEYTLAQEIKADIFANGDKVVDLSKDYTYPLYHMPTALIKRELLNNLNFDTKIKISEDLKFMSEVLGDSPELKIFSTDITRNDLSARFLIGFGCDDFSEITKTTKSDKDLLSELDKIL